MNYWRIKEQTNLLWLNWYKFCIQTNPRNLFSLVKFVLCRFPCLCLSLCCEGERPPAVENLSLLWETATGWKLRWAPKCFPVTLFMWLNRKGKAIYHCRLSRKMEWFTAGLQRRGYNRTRAPFCIMSTFTPKQSIYTLWYYCLRTCIWKKSVACVLFLNVFSQQLNVVFSWQNAAKDLILRKK